MKELYDFKNTLNEMSEPIVYTNDFGGQRNLQDLDPISGLTYLEQGMASLYGDIGAHGKSVPQAKKIVDNAIKELVKEKALPEPPKEEDSDGAKAMWLSSAKWKVKAHLQMLGELM